MRKIIAFCVCLFVIICLLSVQAYAHPGRTDSNGGHYDHSTGEYHYHSGSSSQSGSSGGSGDYPPGYYGSGSSGSGSSSGGGDISVLGLLAVIAVGGFMLYIYLKPRDRSVSSYNDVNKTVQSTSSYKPQPASTPSLQKAPEPEIIKETEYSWDEAWDDYIETDPDNSEPQDSIQDLYDFLDNLPDL
jgi:hypothetical protein